VAQRPASACRNIVLKKMLGAVSRANRSSWWKVIVARARHRLDRAPQRQAG
jgi:hypothetical protein